MPSPPNRRARSASSTVSALARTRSRRTSSARPMIRCTARTRSSASAPSGSRRALEVLDHRRGDHRHLAGVDQPGRAVDGDHVTLVDHGAVRGGQPAALGVDVELLGPAHARLAHPAGDDRGVAGLAAAAGQDALCGDHAVQVVRVGLPAHQDDLLPRPGPLHRGVGVEHRLAHRRTRRGGHPAPEDGELPRPIRCGVELREHQLHQLRPGHPPQRLVGVDHALVDQLGGDPERRAGGPLADPGLQHPQRAALDGELDVAQVAGSAPPAGP